MWCAVVNGCGFCSPGGCRITLRGQIHKWSLTLPTTTGFSGEWVNGIKTQ